MRSVLSAAVLVVAALVVPAGSAAAAPGGSAPWCDGAATRERGLATCTSTTTATRLSGVVVATQVGPGPEAGLTQHTTGWSRTETVVETTTVRSRRGAGPVTTATSDRVVSSAVQPLQCNRFFTVPRASAFGHQPVPFAQCAALGLFTSPTVNPGPVPSDDPDACSGVLVNARGTKTCTETVVRPVLGDVTAAVATGPYQGPFTTTFYTGTSRTRTVLERTTTTSRKGSGPVTTSTSERVLSSSVEPVACHAWTATLRGGTGPDGLQDLATCRGLGLLPV